MTFSCLKRELFPGGDADLFLIKVDACHLLGDGVLDLNAGVDLEQVIVLLLVYEELDRAGVFDTRRL